MMVRTATLLFLMMLLVVVVLTGCWDRREIDTLGFVIGMAVDIAEGSVHGEERQGPAARLSSETNYLVTFQVAVPESLPAASGGGNTGGTGSGAKKPYYNMSTTSPSFFAANRELSTRSDRSLFFEHMQILIISEEVARKGVRPIVDFLTRDNEMRRRVLIFVSQGPARDLLEISPITGDDTVSFYLDDLSRNIRKTGRMTDRVFLGDINRSFRQGDDFVTTRATPGEGEIKLAGGALFNYRGKMISWLSELEMEAYNLLRGTYQSGVIIVPLPGESSTVASWEVSGAKRTMHVEMAEDGRLHFEVNIEVEGSIGEIISDEEMPVSITSELIEEMNNIVAEQLRAELENVLKKLKNLGADGMGFLDTARIRYPRLSRELNERWHDEYWPEATVNVKVEADTRRSGVLL